MTNGGQTVRGDPERGERIRLLLVDDQALLRESFKKLLELAGDDLTVLGAAANGAEAVAAVERLAATGQPPHVVLMDVRMPGMNGVEATRQIVARWPAVRVVILSTFDDEEYIVEGLQAGACGYLLKDASSDELVRAIHDAHRGLSPIQPVVASKLVARLARAAPQSGPPPSLAGSSLRTAEGLPVDELTEREREILRYVAQGASNREIGEALFITEGTVKNHVSNILSKLGLRDRTQAALYAHEHGMV